MKQQVSPTKPIKEPDVDHPIAIEHNTNRVVVSVGGRVVADTRGALTLREAAYPPVHYVPRNDVDMTLLERPNTLPIAHTRAIAPISAFRSAGHARSMPHGLTRIPMRR